MSTDTTQIFCSFCCSVSVLIILETLTGPAANYFGLFVFPFYKRKNLSYPYHKRKPLYVILKAYS